MAFQQSAAARLDAADGVMDGRFHGRPIVQAGGAQFGGFPQQQFGGFPQQQFGGFPQQQFGGIQQVGGFQQGFPQQFGGFPQQIGGFAPQSNAAALDAADGVMDGRFHGRPIVQAGGAQFGGFGGVVQGQPSFVQAPPIVTNQPLGGFGGFPQQQFGGFQQVGGFQQGFPQQFGGFPQQQFGGQAAAARLDAADGVIDGQFFGRPIVRGA